MSVPIPLPTLPHGEGTPDTGPGQAQGLFEALLLGSRPPAVPAIHSSLGVCPDYLAPEEMEDFLRAHRVDALLADVDLHRPSAEPDPALATWPSVALKDPVRMFRELRVTRDPATRRILAPAGTREFAQKYFRSDIWTGSDEDLHVHEEKVKTANFLLFLLTQEDLGLDDPRLLVQLRFFTAVNALEVLAGYEDNPDAWGAGQLHPDNDHLALLMRVTVPQGFCLVPVRLVIPEFDVDPLPAAAPAPEHVAPELDASLFVHDKEGALGVDLVEPTRDVPVPAPELPSRARADEEDPFLPVLSSSTAENFRQKVDELMNFYAPGFLARQADAKKMPPDTSLGIAAPLQLYLSPEGLIRLIRHCGGVEWKFTDPDGTAYAIWLAEGEHIPSQANVVATVCLRSTRRSKAETFTFRAN